MRPSFICLRCAARLAKPSSRLLRSNKRSIHTEAIPSERPPAAILPIRHDRESQHTFLQHEAPNIAAERRDGNGNFNGDDDVYGYGRSHGAGSHSPAHSVPERQDGRLSETAIRRDTRIEGIVRRVTPRARCLKDKILDTQGNLAVVHGDLVKTYGMSRSEASHALHQLERLLRNNAEAETERTAASRLDQYLAWKTQFSSLLRKLADPSSTENVPNTSPTMSEADNMAWQPHDQDMREHVWSQMFLSAVESRPDILPALFEYTFDPTCCPSYVMEDALYLLFRRRQSTSQADETNHDDSQQQGIEFLVTFILGKCPPGYLALPQALLWHVLSRLPITELHPWYQFLVSIEHPLLPNTLLHLARRFAKNHDTKVHAVEILGVLTDIPEYDLNTPAAAGVCISLLTLNKDELPPDQHAVAPDVLFEFLVKRGFRPDLVGLSALMRNFCVRGHLNMGWKVFDLMLQYDIKPDQHVYSILLNGCKRNLDQASLEQIIHIISEGDAWSHVLLNDFLHLLFRENEAQPEPRRRQRKKSNNAWRTMLLLYAKFFNLAPLQKFTFFSLENLTETWIVPPRYKTTATKMVEFLKPQSRRKLMYPDSITLSLMLAAHMRSILLPKYAIRYYHYFCRLVRNKNPLALRLVEEQGSMVYNIFIRTLMQFQETTGFAIQQVAEMIRAAKIEKEQIGHNLHHPFPSVHTWTALVNGLKNHKDTRGALSILQIMGREGVQPNSATWNALIQAFARTDNVTAAVKGVWALEKAGFRPDRHTIRAFNMLSQRLKDSGISMLENMRKTPEQFAHVISPIQDATPSYGRSDDFTQHSQSGLGVPRTLEEVAKRQGEYNIRAIEVGSKKYQKRRAVNSTAPLGMPRGNAGRRLYM
ncbi:hypothetical protein F4777DRAFT_216844 [Nemania sp. FL0916]|nr:hypothetical protein F4777DRAFT_216844 [Nemania sp. FL0916]